MQAKCYTLDFLVILVGLQRCLKLLRSPFELLNFYTKQSCEIPYSSARAERAFVMGRQSSKHFRYLETNTELHSGRQGEIQLRSDRKSDTRQGETPWSLQTSNRGS